MSAARETRSRSTIVTAATLGVLLATGVVMASPAAYAADLPAAEPRAAATSTTARTPAPGSATTAAAAAKPTTTTTAAAAETGKPSLTVRGPASLGNGGRPVEFTETVTNPGATDASYNLRLDARSGHARSPGPITVDSLSADGSWKPVELTSSQTGDGFHLTGEIPDVTVAAGATRTLRLRLGAPLDDDRAGIGDTLGLTSALVDPAAKTVLAESTRNVALKALSVRTEGAPSAAVIGGAPAEFDVTVANPSASDYDNASLVLQADRHSTLQVRTADGGWENVTGTPAQGPGGKVLYRLTEDRTLTAEASVTKRVRLAFTEGATAGTTHVTPWAVLDEGGRHPAYVGPQGFPVDLCAAAPTADVTAATGTGSGTGTRTGTGTVRVGYATATDSDSGSTAALAGGELARTGTSGMRQAALGAAALLAVGIGAVFLARRRRRA